MLALLGIFIVSFLIVFLSMPAFIRKMSALGYTVLDQYKPSKPRVANMGGLVILAGVIGSVVSALLLVGYSEQLLVVYYMVIFSSLLGLVDDLRNLNRAIKIFLPFLLVLSISIVARDPNVGLWFFTVNFGIFYVYLIAPTYVMVVSNLINMHSGYNGLAIGLSSILFFFSSLKSYMLHGPDSLILIAPMFGAILAFWYYDRYPSKVFLGNCGSFTIGVALGSFLVLNKLELFGVVALFPHIVNFLMYVVWKIKKIGEVKFGRLRSDGTLIVPNNLTLKWLLPYYFRLNERQATDLMYLLTTIFCAAALLV